MCDLRDIVLDTLCSSVFFSKSCCIKLHSIFFVFFIKVRIVPIKKLYLLRDCDSIPACIAFVAYWSAAVYSSIEKSWGRTRIDASRLGCTKLVSVSHPVHTRTLTDHGGYPGNQNLNGGLLIACGISDLCLEMDKEQLSWPLQEEFLWRMFDNFLLNQNPYSRLIRSWRLTWPYSLDMTDMDAGFLVHWWEKYST